MYDDREFIHVTGVVVQREDYENDLTYLTIKDREEVRWIGAFHDQTLCEPFRLGDTAVMFGRLDEGAFIIVEYSSILKKGAR